MEELLKEILEKLTLISAQIERCVPSEVKCAEQQMEYELRKKQWDGIKEDSE